MASHQHKHLCPNNLPWQAKAFDPSQGQATITHLQSSSRMMPPSLPFSCTFSSSFTLLPASSTITSSLACISSPSTYPPTATNSLSTSSCLGTSFFQPSYGAACSLLPTPTTASKSMGTPSLLRPIASPWAPQMKDDPIMNVPIVSIMAR